MKLPFMKSKKKDEPSHVHVKKKRVQAVSSDQQRIEREIAYEKKLNNNSQSRRSYRHGL
jgi:ribosomal protein L35AE/L33A